MLKYNLYKFNGLEIYMKKDNKNKIIAAVTPIVIVVLTIIGSVNDIISFGETIDKLLSGSSITKKILYVIIFLAMVIFLIIIVNRLIKYYKKYKKDKANQKFLMAMQQKKNNTNDLNYVKPFLSNTFEDIMAKTSEDSTQYNAEKMLYENINVEPYEIVLAKKIARADDPDSCVKAYELLHTVINRRNVFLNSNKQIVSYWIFIALNEDQYKNISSGNINEKDIKLKDVNFIDVRGRYYGYLLLSGSSDSCKTTENRAQLYDSWLKYLENLAKKGYFFNEIASMVGSEWGNSSLSSIGMTNYTEYKFGGQMYKYELSDIRNIDYLVKYYPTLVKLYEKEYGEKNNNDNK